MLLDDFDFHLPPTSIAQQPIEPRDAARLLDLSAGGMADRHVYDLPDLLRSGDLLVVNNTRVLPARLFGKRGEANIEITLHKSLGKDIWRAFAKPAKKCRPGDTLVFGEGLSAQVISREGPEVDLAFTHDFPHMIAALEAYGTMPLPPYIKRDKGGDDQQKRHDADHYQTVFAAQPGAVAAPTAGLHFTPRLLAQLEAKGIARAEVTLHVGAGTFLPVTAQRVEDHVMHSEWCHLPAATAAAIADTRAKGGRVVAVGTTSLRTLEATGGLEGTLDTNIFITPGYEFRATDMLITNFHLPKSTLFMLVSAFTSLDHMQKAYAHAIESGYRFFSYGDACLLERKA